MFRIISIGFVLLLSANLHAEENAEVRPILQLGAEPGLLIPVEFYLTDLNKLNIRCDSHACSTGLGDRPLFRLTGVFPRAGINLSYSLKRNFALQLSFQPFFYYNSPLNGLENIDLISISFRYLFSVSKLTFFISAGIESLITFDLFGSAPSPPLLTLGEKLQIGVKFFKIWHITIYGSIDTFLTPFAPIALAPPSDVVYGGFYLIVIPGISIICTFDIISAG